MKDIAISSDNSAPDAEGEPQTYTVKANMILRRVEGGKTMLLGVLDSDLCLETNPAEPNDDQVWIGEIRLMPLARFSPPEGIFTGRADQVLTTVIDVSDLKQL